MKNNNCPIFVQTFIQTHWNHLLACTNMSLQSIIHLSKELFERNY